MKVSHPGWAGSVRLAPAWHQVLLFDTGNHRNENFSPAMTRVPNTAVTPITTV